MASAWRFSLSAGIAAVLSACATAPVTTSTDPADQTQRDWGTTNALTDKGYFALVEHSGTHWQLLRFARTPITHRDNLQQEILWVSDNGDTTKLSFTQVKSWKPTRAQFVCDQPLDEAIAYTPCSSRFVISSDDKTKSSNQSATPSNASNPYKTVDTKSLKTATHALQLSFLARQVTTQRQELHNTFNLAADAYANVATQNVRWNFKIVDESGYFVHADNASLTPLVKRKPRSLKPSHTLFMDSGNFLEGYTPGTESAENFLKEIFADREAQLRSFELKHLHTYDVECQAERYRAFNIRLECPATVKRNATTSAPVVVVVKSLVFENAFPLYSTEDTNLKVAYDGNAVRFTNTTKDFLHIRSVAMHYNNHTALRQGWSISIAPQATTKPYALMEFASDYIKNAATLTGITKDTAKDTELEFGFSMTYAKGANQQTHQLAKTTLTNLDHLITETLALE